MDDPGEEPDGEDTVLLSADEPGTERKVVIEDDGRTVYAYLLHADYEFVGDVWLYNSVETPAEPEWNDRTLMPFRNSREYCVADSVRALDPESVVSCIWFDRGAFVFLDGVLVARLEEGSLPGWSVTAAKDGPLAKRFDKDEMGPRQLMLFRVRLKGRNFVRDGVLSGFYANRFVEAPDAQAAVGVAIASLQTRTDIWRQYVEGRSAHHAPTFDVDDVQEVEGPAPGEQGLVWFPMD